jgi:hypothetical protein
MLVGHGGEDGVFVVRGENGVARLLCGMAQRLALVADHEAHLVFELHLRDDAELEVAFGPRYLGVVLRHDGVA